QTRPPATIAERSPERDDGWDGPTRRQGYPCSAPRCVRYRPAREPVAARNIEQSSIPEQSDVFAGEFFGKSGHLRLCIAQHGVEIEHPQPGAERLFLAAGFGHDLCKPRKGAEVARL